jgi:KDO2-lipid IV(A) lauroyltransferase
VETLSPGSLPLNQIAIIKVLAKRGMKLDHMVATTTSPKDATRSEAIRRLDSKRGSLTNFIARIPKGYITGLGKIVGHFLYYFDLPHRRIVRRNLQFIHPEWSRNQIQNLAKRIFQHLGITILEFLQMAYLSHEELIRNVQIERQEILAEALANQRGVVLISAHLGNWETAWQVCPSFFQRQITGVAKKLRNVQLNQLIHTRRTRFGNRILYKKGALPDMMKTLRQGEIVGILMDISRRFEGVEVDFFGHRATATPAAALLAIRCKSPIIAAFSHRNAKGQLIIHIEPPIEIERTGDLRTDLQINTQLITDRVERAVRNYPEQWNWTLKRWKDFYPDLYPESEKRKRRIKMKLRKKRN